MSFSRSRQSAPRGELRSHPPSPGNRGAIFLPREEIKKESQSAWGYYGPSPYSRKLVVEANSKRLERKRKGKQGNNSTLGRARKKRGQGARLRAGNAGREREILASKQKRNPGEKGPIHYPLTGGPRAEIPIATVLRLPEGFPEKEVVTKGNWRRLRTRERFARRGGDQTFFCEESFSCRRGIKKSR